MLRFLMAGVLVLAACQSPSRPPTMALVTPSPDYSDPSKPITVRTGDTFSVALGANPSLDYNWHIQTIDESHIALTGRDHDTIWRESDTPPAGFGGISRLTFEGKAPGETTLTLILKQGERPPEDTATFNVTVNPR